MASKGRVGEEPSTIITKQPGKGNTDQEEISSGLSLSICTELPTFLFFVLRWCCSSCWILGQKMPLDAILDGHALARRGGRLENRNPIPRLPGRSADLGPGGSVRQKAVGARVPASHAVGWSVKRGRRHKPTTTTSRPGLTDLNLSSSSPRHVAYRGHSVLSAPWAIAL